MCNGAAELTASCATCADTIDHHQIPAASVIELPQVPQTPVWTDYFVPVVLAL